MYEQTLLRVELLIALVTLAAIAKSAWNGWLRRKIIVPLDRLEDMTGEIESMGAKTDEMYRRQEYQIDAIIALARAMEENGEFDEQEFRDSVGRESDPEDFLRGGGSDG